jgi:hypothetical protein
MNENVWYCEKCGNKNNDLTCKNCGCPKLTSGSELGIKFHTVAFVDFALILAMLIALAKVCPSFADVFKSHGAKLPWLTDAICGFGYFLKPIGDVLIVVVGSLGGIFFFNPKIKKKVEFKYLIYLLLLLIVLLVIFLIGLFSPMFYLGS